MSSSGFSINDCDVVGFDMDQTLCRYNNIGLSEVMQNGITKMLVEKKGYPKNFKETIKRYQHLVCAGGLMLDIPNGAFLKIDSFGHIDKMFYHKDFLTTNQIENIYLGCRWPHVEDVKKGVFRVSGSYWFMEDNFSVAVISIIAAIFVHEIDLCLSRGSTPDCNTHKKAFKTFEEVGAMLWDEKTYSKGTSYFFEYVKKHPNNVLQKVSEEVKDWIAGMRDSGKFVFLMTSSHCDYADLVMSYCFNSNWTDSFDLVISKARKPKFFTEQNQFKVVDIKQNPVSEVFDSNVLELEKGKWYSQGNCEILSTLLKNDLQKNNPVITYFGDSLESDVVSSSIFYKWKPAYIMESLRCNPDRVFSLGKDEEDFFFSQSWGPLLSCTSTGNQSLYSNIITSRSTIAVSSLDYLVRKGNSFPFDQFANNNKNLFDGFHPKPSASLLILKDLIKFAKKV